MKVRAIAFGVVGVAACVSVLSVLVIPWGWYGTISISAWRLPYWGLHLVAVAVAYACALWTLLTSPKRISALVLAAAAGVLVVGATVFVALGYNNASALFDEWIPMVNPRLGSGPFVAALAALAALAAGALGAGKRPQNDRSAIGVGARAVS
ncbi:hypothetical protein [Micromonospora sp. DT229]|uniref:hypothetical protein n=1 Tax=Micromonospora sp. DT229 TaxID=3393430 RepID=UPI003CE98004